MEAHVLELSVDPCGNIRRALLSALLQLKTVTSLDISGQPLRKAGFVELSSFLRADRKLEILRACDVAAPHTACADMVDFTKAMEINSSLVVLDLRSNRLQPGIAGRLRRTMEEKRSTVPLAFDAKICFLLCNRHLPGHLQLPEVAQVFEASRLYTGGAHSPLFMIFQFCGRPRQLLLDEASGSSPELYDQTHPAWLPARPSVTSRQALLAMRLGRRWDEARADEMDDEDGWPMIPPGSPGVQSLESEMSVESDRWGPLEWLMALLSFSAFSCQFVHRGMPEGAVANVTIARTSAQQFQCHVQCGRPVALLVLLGPSLAATSWNQKSYAFLATESHIVIDIDPYPDDEVMHEFDVDGTSTPDDEGVHERRRSDEVAQMQATRPEIIRAAPVCTVLRGLARPLRGAAGDFYHFSRQTNRLSAFWSHSWHGSAMQKIASIFFFYKATAATVLGTTAAVGADVFFALNLLPGFGAQGRSCWWGVITGCSTYLLVMLFWQPRQLVFLDRVCISQSDPGLQAEGLLSLGAILKSSDSMLVLWDPSWARRLWCVFELAAFLHSRPPGETPRVLIRPTILGFTILAFWFAGVLFACCLYITSQLFSDTSIYYVLILALVPGAGIFFVVAHLVRDFCRSVTTMCHQIGEFRFETAESYCCSTNHRSDSGETMICDREVIQQTINIWFGSVESFEQRVQNEVCDLLSHQLLHRMISYWRLAEATPMFFLLLLDQAAERLHDGLQDDTESFFGVYHLIRGIIYWLAVIPFLMRVLLRVAWMLQAQHPCRLLDWMKTSLILLVACVLVIAFVSLDIFGGFYAFVFTSISLALFTWRYLPVPVPKRAKSTE
ncbi:Rai14 [Symbiodinium sp. CCMP2592]|nr:Rai14 [Symbiodinium sp. CCMP2592]